MHLLVALAFAYETDQLTHRDRPLEDVRELANERMDFLIEEAVAHANAKTHCEGTVPERRKVLAKEIYRHTAKHSLVHGRGPFRAPGHGRYSSYLEMGPVDRIDFLGREDLYGQLPLVSSPLLTLSGPCSTVQLAGVRMGTDKVHHFLSVGYYYWQRSDDGADPERAIRYGTRTEYLYWGLLTSQVFSFADLESNWRGYVFYSRLLEPGSEVQVGDDGCMELAHPFDWGIYVTDGWDEVVNPPVLRARVDKRLQERLISDRDAICAAYASWGGEDYLRERAHYLHMEPFWVGEQAPVAEDPFAIEELCAQ